MTVTKKQAKFYKNLQFFLISFAEHFIRFSAGEEGGKLVFEGGIGYNETYTNVGGNVCHG